MRTANTMNPMVQGARPASWMPTADDVGSLAKDAPQVTIREMTGTSLFNLIQSNQDSMAYFFVNDGSSIQDWPAGLTSTETTFYGVISIKKMLNVSYINVVAVNSAGFPHRVDGYKTDVGIVWGNVY